MFATFLRLAFEHGIVKQDALLKMIPPRSILDALKNDRTRLIAAYQRVMQMDATFVQKFAAKLSVERMVEDITIALDADSEAADRLRGDSVFDAALFVDQLPLGDIYSAVMPTAMRNDAPTNRAFAAQLLSALVAYEAFGPQHQTERHIMKSIGFDVLMSDKVPAKLRSRMMNAIYRGGQDLKDERRPMYAFVFDALVGGVSFGDLAVHLPVLVMARPFAAYVDMLGLVKTTVVKPSEFPPVGGVDVFPTAPPPIPIPRVPRPVDAAEPRTPRTSEDAPELVFEPSEQ